MTRSSRDAGVDIDEARRAMELIGRAAASTATPQVLGAVGGFGSLFRFEAESHPEPVLVASTDGVGTKLKVALALGRHDTVGIDLVNHCINDIAVQGADPLFFLDYLGIGRLRAEVVDEIVSGIASACAAAGVALVGGETAELPDLYQGDDYDLAGRILRQDEWGHTAPGLSRTIGEELLEPHRSYLDEMRILRRALRAAGGDVLAFAHITGGGWIDNIPRTLPDGLGVEVEAGSWPVPRIFSLIQERGDVPDAEMVRTFNLGIGLTAVVRPDLVDAATAALPELLRVGSVVAVDEGQPRVVFR